MTAANATTTAGLQNAGADMVSSVASAEGLVGPIFVLVLYIVGTLLAAQFVAPWIAQSDTLERLLGGFAQSFVYAIKGAATSAVLLVVATPAYLLLTVDASTRQVAAKWIGVAIGGYVALNVVGWLADRAVAAYIDAHPDAKEWDDLWPDVEDDDDER